MSKRKDISRAMYDANRLVVLSKDMPMQTRCDALAKANGLMSAQMWEAVREHSQGSRQTGTTTQMLLRAAISAIDGETVCVVGYSDRYSDELTTELQKLLREYPEAAKRVATPANQSKAQVVYTDHYKV